MNALTASRSAPQRAPASRALRATAAALLSAVTGLTAWLLLASPAAAQEGPQMDLPRVALTYGMHRIDAQVAATPSTRQIGLMNRKDMPAHEGMVFIFEEPGVQCFWMKNTLLPLAVAFIGDDGTIVNIDEMKPQTLNSHCSEKPVRYVLEMNKGWFTQKGIKAGAKLNSQLFGAK
jgi:uncharacterized membrane protein (UPF0127 family)